jgi:hypothetical protein
MLVESSSRLSSRVVTRTSSGVRRKLPHRFLVFTVLLVRRFFVIKIGAEIFPGKSEMVNKFSFANLMSIYRVVASRCVAAI